MTSCAIATTTTTTTATTATTTTTTTTATATVTATATLKTRPERHCQTAFSRVPVSCFDLQDYPMVVVSPGLF